MAETWFESVAEAQRRAEKRLPASVFSALRAGSERGVTLRNNVEAFDEIGFAPYTAGLSDKRDLSTTVLGHEISFPVLISPTGAQAVHPDGEVAVARASAARGTALGLSSFATKPVEDVVAANPKTYFQIYWIGTRDDMLRRVERAKAAGVAGLILTLDWSFSHSRDWGSPHIPERLTLREMLRFTPEVIRKPKWLLSYAKTGKIPNLTVPNMADAGGEVPAFFGAYGQWMGSPLPTWDDVRWLREQWDGPFLLKGIIRVDEARRAVDAGVSAISVSNHGGNNLDGTPAAIRALPAIADAVGDQVEVLFDGGIRRGSDVVKAVALGARAVLIGRASLWALAAGGQAGVENVLDVLRAGADSALLALGHNSIHDLTRNDVILPPDSPAPSATPSGRKGWSSSVMDEVPCYTASQAAKAAEVDLPRARRYWRALGFVPVEDDAVAFTESDVEVLRVVTSYVDEGALDEPDSLRLTRILGRAIAQMVQLQMEILTNRVAPIDRHQPDFSDPAVVRRGVASRLPEVQWLLGQMWHRQMATALTKLDEADVGHAAVSGVGFADIVGFTALSRERSDADLVAIIERFGAGCLDIITARGGTVVKMLGDEVMFTAEDPAALAAIGLRLGSAFDGDPDIPGLRIGLSLGPIIRHLGDIFGTTVNLASRLTALAEPHTVLLSPTLAEALRDSPAFTLIPLERQEIRGIGSMTPVLLK